MGPKNLESEVLRDRKEKGAAENHSLSILEGKSVGVQGVPPGDILMG